MAIKEMSPRLQLSFDEYVETWRSLITEYYSRGLDQEITDDILCLDEEGLIRYSAEFSAVMLFIALSIWSSRKRISQSIRTAVDQAIVEKFYGELLKDEGLAGEYTEFYRAKAELFCRLLNIRPENFKAKQNEIVGFARYMVAQASDKPEKKNLKSIEMLCVILAEAAKTFYQLAENSAPDAQFVGKTKFIVQK
jgi:hypothetical protein